MGAERVTLAKARTDRLVMFIVNLLILLALCDNRNAVLAVYARDAWITGRDLLQENRELGFQALMSADPAIGGCAKQ